MAEQFDQRRLADQGFEFEVGVGGQGVHHQAQAGASGAGAVSKRRALGRSDAFPGLQVFGEEHVGTQGRVHTQQALGLGQATPQDGQGGIEQVQRRHGPLPGVARRLMPRCI